ncbi:hypothetical protein AMJ39_07820 [candidate division TA06 bacterium DG_24]|uniref:Sialidase domain-containing protein n=1 Tax=candidate division TA06 bacterium DG_24 TaxID=1703770 RepID=A0A0S7WQI9_UNCT6|nr:MAG: hypothetical protein AMJ39_07820 [candidate division TA06 bacterium DG_24]
MVYTLMLLMMMNMWLVPVSENVEVQIAATNDPNATLGIPRHKVHVSQSNPGQWWVLYGKPSGNLKMSTDRGQTWTGLEPDAITVWEWLDYHAEMAGDDEGNLHFTFPEPAAHTQLYRRMDAPARTRSDLRAAVTLADLTPGNWNRGSILVDGSTVWVFSRSSYAAAGNVRYHRSTDGGITWYATPEDSGYVRQTGCSNVRIGSVEYMGKPTVVIWYDGEGYRYYVREGSNWVGHPDSTIYWGTCTRQFSISVIADSTFHIVWQDTDDSGLLRHAWKHFSGGTGEWHYGIVDENPGNGNFLPMLTRSGTTLYVVYSRLVGQRYERAICYRVWNGNNWSIVPLRVSRLSDNCLHPNAPPSVPPEANHIPVVWTAGANAPYRVMCGRMPVTPVRSIDGATSGSGARIPPKKSENDHG